MTHPTASLNYSERQAGSLRTGDLLLLPAATRTAEIQSVDVDNDDFGSPAIVRATLTGGGVLRIAAGSVVLVRDDEPDATADSPADAAPASGACGAAAASADDGGPELQLVQHLPADDGSPAAAPAVVVPPPPVAPPAAS